MRINRYIAAATGMSRRAADTTISEQRVRVNGTLVTLGQEVHPADQIMLDGQTLSTQPVTVTIMLNKPPGYVVSRDGQGSPTVYELLPQKYHHLKPAGRLDKDSSGLLFLTDDGELAHKLTHPSFQKEKIYEVKLDKPLSARDEAKLEQGIKLEDGLSRLQLKPLDKPGQAWQITMHEGRNRQIRRTFAAVGYTVVRLRRTQLGPYKLTDLSEGSYKALPPMTPTL